MGGSRGCGKDSKMWKGCWKLTTSQPCSWSMDDRQWVSYLPSSATQSGRLASGQLPGFDHWSTHSLRKAVSNYAKTTTQSACSVMQKSHAESHFEQIAATGRWDYNGRTSWILEGKECYWADLKSVHSVWETSKTPERILPCLWWLQKAFNTVRQEALLATMKKN